MSTSDERERRLALRTEQWQLSIGYHDRQPWSAEHQRLLTEAGALLAAGSDYARSLRREQDRRLDRGGAARVHEGSAIGVADWWVARCRNLVTAIRKRQQAGGMTPAEVNAARTQLARLRRMSPQPPAPRRSAARSTATAPGPSPRVRALRALTPAQTRAKVDAAVQRVSEEGTFAALMAAASEIGPLVAVRAITGDDAQARLLATARALHLGDDRAHRVVDDGLLVGMSTIKVGELG